MVPGRLVPVRYNALQGGRNSLTSAERLLPSPVARRQRRNTSMDRAFWHGIVDANYAVPSTHMAASSTSELLPYLGSPDPALREQLGYAIIVRWIYDGRYAP